MIPRKLITTKLLTGQDSDVMVPFHTPGQQKPILIHPLMIEPLEQLQKVCAQEGFELAIASGFRSLEQQQRIWNLKAQGERAVLDSHGRPLDFMDLSDQQKVLSIMRWSALPGASRHHWGSEIDVYNFKAKEQVELTPDEVDNHGPMGPFHVFLNEVLDEFDFFRPYEFDLGGVAPERWHLSFAPVSEPCDEAYDREVFLEILRSQNIELKDTVLSMADELFDRFVKAITPRSS